MCQFFYFWFSEDVPWIVSFLAAMSSSSTSHCALHCGRTVSTASQRWRGFFFQSTCWLFWAHWLFLWFVCFHRFYSVNTLQHYTCVEKVCQSNLKLKSVIKAYCLFNQVKDSLRLKSLFSSGEHEHCCVTVNTMQTYRNKNIQLNFKQKENSKFSGDFGATTGLLFSWSIQIPL